MGDTHSIVQQLQHCRHDADRNAATVNTKAGRKHNGGMDNMPKDVQPNREQNTKIFVPECKQNRGRPT